ncbi:MAG: DUF4190 domain-containing protein [bacterium]|nr:DUF4190 domain-containing protein [bacterium]
MPEHNASPPPITEEKDEAISYVVPYKNPAALFAYYLGIFSFIPCLGIVLGLAALVLGIMGLVYASRHEHAHGRAHAWIGIVVGGFFFLAWTVAALLIFLPPLMDPSHLM